MDKDKAKGKAVYEQSLSFLSAVQLKVFKTFVKVFKETGELKKDEAIALDSAFGSTMIVEMFEILDEEQAVIRQCAVSDNVLVEVSGTGGNVYWIRPGFNICQCMYFRHKKKFCKHILAAHLCLALTPRENYKEISEEEIFKIYKENLGSGR